MSRDSVVRHWLRPGLIALHLFAVAAVGFCIVMGLWQLGVYDSRQDHERADRQDVPQVELAGLWGSDDAWEPRLNQRPVTMDGQFAPADQQVWVTGQDQGDRQGAWLLAPFLVEGDDQAMLVVRGWSPEVTDLPPVPSGPTTVEGVLQSGQAGGASFDPAERTIGSVRIPALTNELPYGLWSGYAITTDAAVAGDLALAELPEPGISWTLGARNLAYALQWWVFGAFAVFMWWRMSTETVTAARAKVASSV